MKRKNISAVAGLFLLASTACKKQEAPPPPPVPQAVNQNVNHQSQDMNPADVNPEGAGK